MSNTFQFEYRRLGEPHNFGKVTCLRPDGKVVKQRNTAWEAAFLSARSPLRQRVESICRAGGMALPLPDLNYKSLPEGGTAVDYLNVLPVTQLSDSDVESLGVSIAVAVWFGMTDLNSENFICGTIANGPRKGFFCATPLDIESIIRPVSDLAATGLDVLTENSTPHALLGSNAGLLPLRGLMAQLAHTSAPAILIGSFSAMFALLQQNRHDFTPLMAQLLDEPVRIFLRQTDFYRSVLSRGTAAVKGTLGLLDEEVRQLLRGDIPWFFALPGSEEIYWFDSPESYKSVRLFSSASFPELRKLPRWPLLTTNDEFAALLQESVRSLVGFFWKSHPINAIHAGIQVSNDPGGIHIRSTGQYQPVARI